MNLAAVYHTNRYRSTQVGAVGRMICAMRTEPMRRLPSMEQHTVAGSDDMIKNEKVAKAL